MNYIKSILLAIFCLFIFSCSSLINSYKNQNVDFENYKKLAVTSFLCDSEYLSGQTLADFITVEFMRKGYQIVERNQMKIIIDEKVLNTTGLTETQKKNLKILGIDAIITGTFQSKRSSIPQLPEVKEMIFEQNSNMSVKMIDSQTGEVLWLSNGLHSEKSSNINFQNIITIFLNDLRPQIPEINKKKWFWVF